MSKENLFIPVRSRELALRECVAKPGTIEVPKMLAEKQIQARERTTLRRPIRLLLDTILQAAPASSNRYFEERGEWPTKEVIKLIKSGR